jgi:hypothetical protein
MKYYRIDLTVVEVHSHSGVEKSDASAVRIACFADHDDVMTLLDSADAVFNRQLSPTTMGDYQYGTKEVRDKEFDRVYGPGEDDTSPDCGRTTTRCKVTS